MLAEFFRQCWVVASISGVLAICGFGFAVLALRRSGKALRASIPEPEVRAAYNEFTVVRMRPADEHRFAISVIASRTDKFLVTADAKLRDLPDIFRGYAPLGRRIRSTKFDPPATSLIIRTKKKGNFIKVRVVSREDPRIFKWIAIKLND